MASNYFSKENREKYLQFFSIILFSEVITLFFLSIPSTLLSKNYELLTFDFLMLIYLLMSLIIPWIYVFFTETSKTYITIIVTSSISFFVFMILSLTIKRSLIIVFYFVILKSIMTGLAALFKILFRIFIDGGTKNKRENFQFIQPGSLQISVKDKISKELEKYDIIGCFILLFVYPVTIMLITNFIFTLV